MVHVNILFSRFTEPFNQSVWALYLSLLPTDIQKRNSGFLRWQDQHSHLIGKLLLKKGLKEIGYEKSLTELKYNQYGRPYLNEKFDFNTSHSGDYVICAIANDVRLGIDIEKVDNIDIADFKNLMRISEWESIVNSKCPNLTFFQYWTIKESVIKADGRGLSIPLKDIYINNEEACLKGKTWFFKKIQIDNDYSCCLATNNSEIDIHMHKICF